MTAELRLQPTMPDISVPDFCTSRCSGTTWRDGVRRPGRSSFRLRMRRNPCRSISPRRTALLYGMERKILVFAFDPVAGRLLCGGFCRRNGARLLRRAWPGLRLFRRHAEVFTTTARSWCAFLKRFVGTCDACETLSVDVSSLSVVRDRRNDYSVPSTYAYRRMPVLGDVHKW